MHCVFCLINWQRALSRRTLTINSMGVGAYTETCEHICVSGYTFILINTHTVYLVCVRASTCVRAGKSVSARVMCFSVCHFDFFL